MTREAIAVLLALMFAATIALMLWTAFLPEWDF